MHDTLIEPTGLIPDTLSQRPAEIIICLSPSSKQTKELATKLQLLDIIIPHSLVLLLPLAIPPGFNESLINLKNLTALADRSHLKSIP
jgi:hypothetical protein